MVISTPDFSALPDVHDLRSLSQALALLDAILCPDWESRYYSFDAHWGAEEALASMRNGEGDHYFCLFNADGAILKGFLHESAMSPFRSNPPRIWPGVLDSVPPQFTEALTEPAFVIDETTFCIWRTNQDSAWQRGDIRFPDSEWTDGLAELLAMLDNNPRTYQRWAESYYERPVSLEAVIHIYEHKQLTGEIIQVLNPDLSLQELSLDIAEIGYAHSQ